MPTATKNQKNLFLIKQNKEKIEFRLKSKLKKRRFLKQTCFSLLSKDSPESRIHLGSSFLH
jgi:hypothetical protein